MKRSFSLLVVLAMIVSCFSGWALFAETNTAPERSISMERTLYTVGEPIKVSYTGASKDDNDWLCIYKASVKEEDYGLSSAPEHTSDQYAYVDGDGMIVFNDIAKADPDNDKNAVASDKYAFDVVNYNRYNKESGELFELEAGEYYATILGAPGWYTSHSNKIYFTIVEEGTKAIALDKTVYTEGEPITATYVNANRENKDWLCIYAGAESEYGVSGGPISLQYAYIGYDEENDMGSNNGTVPFNDLNTDKMTVLDSELDASYDETDKIFYQPDVETLKPGVYHLIMLGSAGWYETQTEKIVFEVKAKEAEAPKFAVSSVEGAIGDTVDVTISLTGAQPISYFNLRLAYDADKLELAAEPVSSLTGVTYGQTLQSNPYPFTWANTTGLDINGTLFTLKFKILDKTASIGTTDLKLTVTEVLDGAQEEITESMIVDDATITITDVECEHEFGACTAAGDAEHTKQCSKCNRVYTEAHTWSEDATIVEATCTTEGSKTVKCTACGYEKTEKTSDALGHAWDEGTVTKAPTCTEAGEKTITCTRCNETKTEAVAATGHAWNDGEVTKAPTCTEAGEKTVTCTKCGATQKEEIAATGHDWNDGEETKAPTCTEAGEKTITCTKCGETKTEEIAATGHSFTKYEYNNDATKTADGTETAACDHGCGATDTRTKEGTKLPNDNPQTGDIGLWIAGIAFLALGAIIALNVYKKKVNG